MTSKPHSELRSNYKRDIGAVQRQLPSYAPTFEMLWQRYLDLLDEGLRLQEQLEAVDKAARLLWQYYLLPLPPEKAAFVREVLDEPAPSPTSEAD